MMLGRQVFQVTIATKTRLGWRKLVCNAVHDLTRHGGPRAQRGEETPRSRPKLFDYSEQGTQPSSQRRTWTTSERPRNPPRLPVMPPWPTPLPTNVEELDSTQFPVTLDKAWQLFLEIIHADSHFQGGLSRYEAFQDDAAVKKAVLRVSRLRADVIYRLPVAELAQLAECFSTDEIEKLKNRKVRNAFKRFVATYAQKFEEQKAGLPDASLQDLLKVIHDLSSLGPLELEAVAPGAGTLTTSLLKQVLAGYFSSPIPEHVAKARQVPKRSPMEQAKREEDAAARRPVQGDEVHTEEGRQRMKLRLIYLIKKSQAPVELDDWFCGTCGVLNFKGRQGCYRCKTPASAPTSMHVDQESLLARYRTVQGCPKRQGPLWAKNPAQPEEVREARRQEREKMHAAKKQIRKERRAAEAAAAAAALEPSHTRRSGSPSSRRDTSGGPSNDQAEQ